MYYYPVVHYWTIWFSESLLYYLKINGHRIDPGDSVIDIGCGLGYHCFRLLKFKPESVTGVDISKNTIDFLNSFNSPINFEVMNISDDSISKYNDKLTIAFSSDVYEHVSDPQVMLNNIYKILKKNGIACITFPNWDHHGQNQFQNIDVLKHQIESAGFVSNKISIIEDYGLMHKLFMNMYIILQRISDLLFRVNRKVINGNPMPESDECHEMYGFQKNLKLKNKKYFVILVNFIFECIRAVTHLMPPFKLSNDLSNVKNKRIIFLAAK